MKLYLMQHGRACAKADDPLRPLTEQGARETELMAQWAVRAQVPVRSILHSGKLRARQTAEIMARHLHPAGGVAVQDGMSPDDCMCVVAEALPERGDAVLLVGHLPHLSGLASWLLSGDANRDMISFRNSGLVCLGRDELSGAWALEWALTPQLLASSV